MKWTQCKVIKLVVNPKGKKKKNALKIDKLITFEDCVLNFALEFLDWFVLTVICVVGHLE